jgi:hypothetical protein
MQECKNARMQECKNARMQECKNARMQECKKGLDETRDMLANAVARYRHPFATCKKRKQEKPTRVN